MTLPAKTILLVEDAPDDVSLFARTLREAGLSHSLITISDGADALRYFAAEGKYADRNQFPIPAIMFLDLNLPTVNGFEILKRARQTHAREQLLIVVMTGGGELSAARRAYAMGADSFIVKPPRLEDFRNLAIGFPAFF